ncbi:hypothetical protein HHK36_017085 [Tetracentron sinense]|uniref:5'-nucleotidase n=1 Tax=Tetracentron sinense TaxID=13715 RepID=A0A834YYU5_TETSI|nr:hypothetical protein HHK36_017085 [Tetracentron sinense]
MAVITDWCCLEFKYRIRLPFCQIIIPADTCGYRDQIKMEELDPSRVSEAVVGDCESLEKKKAAIRNAGPAKFQVIADFDATLTQYWINGLRGQSSHGLLQQGNPEYDVKRHELFEYYHPLEFSPTIPIEEKAKLMEEWWEKTHSLLIEGGLTYDAIEKSVANARIAFREGVIELFELLEERGVPVLIFLAGLADIIEEVCFLCGVMLVLLDLSVDIPCNLFVNCE